MIFEVERGESSGTYGKSHATDAMITACYQAEAPIGRASKILALSRSSLWEVPIPSQEADTMLQSI